VPTKKVFVVVDSVWRLAGYWLRCGGHANFVKVDLLRTVDVVKSVEGVRKEATGTPLVDNNVGGDERTVDGNADGPLSDG
jgi:hypothetical protein